MQGTRRRGVNGWQLAVESRKPLAADRKRLQAAMSHAGLDQRAQPQPLRHGMFLAGPMILQDRSSQ